MASSIIQDQEQDQDLGRCRYNLAFWLFMPPLISSASKLNGRVFVAPLFSDLLLLFVETQFWKNILCVAKNVTKVM